MSRPKSTSTEIKNRITAMAVIADELVAKEKESLDKVMEILKEVIHLHPQLHGIAWTQYIPSFMDGDACEFTMGEIEFLIEGSEEYMDESTLIKFIEKNKDVLDFKEQDKFKKICGNMSEVVSILSCFASPLRNMFGDHTRVKLTRKGIETEEYDCGY